MSKLKCRLLGTERIYNIDNKENLNQIHITLNNEEYIIFYDDKVTFKMINEYILKFMCDDEIYCVHKDDMECNFKIINKTREEQMNTFEF